MYNSVHSPAEKALLWLMCDLVNFRYIANLSKGDIHHLNDFSSNFLFSLRSSNSESFCYWHVHRNFIIRSHDQQLNSLVTSHSLLHLNSQFIELIPKHWTCFPFESAIKKEKIFWLTQLSLKLITRKLGRAELVADQLI